ncbi:chloramphenicol acetyltransferase [Segetibacter koreensis]|uniref:chloramphenicol acetyltransferase n=1 Tax=Segetibacter koreensis TaxID=398037 RepID=UPI0003709700|nr:chloramphenicol acetyltransferase [Segetibacter koreensis]
MKQKLNLDDWNRKDHFKFFNQFEEPFFGVTVTIDCTTAYTMAKDTRSSFFLFYLYKSLEAANKTRPFLYRIEGTDVIVYDQVNASPTINRNDGTFGFAYIDYYEDYQTFYKEAQKEIDKVQSTSGLIPAVSGENVIHYSSIPWLNFTSLSHARAFAFKDSIPKISFGKMTIENGVRKMPVSIHVHHGLMDGYHVGEYVDLFQELMNKI